MRLALILLLGLGCARGYVKPYARASDEATKLITSVVEHPQPIAWRNSKWFRQELDTVTPLRIYFSGLWACVLDLPPVREPRLNEYFRCPVSWRLPRG